MTVAKVPLPPGLAPDTTIQLRRLSGRPQGMFYDAAKTQGPIYFTRPQLLGTNDLYTDVGLYELVVGTTGGVLTVTQVQVGVGSTPTTDTGDLVTFEALQQALDAQHVQDATVFAVAAQPQTITGDWDFTGDVTLNGAPLGSGGGTGDVTTAELNDAITAAIAGEVTRADNKYPSRTAAATISGSWDFTGNVTIDGVPIGTGGGTVDLTGYATETYVGNAIAGAQMGPALAYTAAGEALPLLFIEPGQTPPPPPTTGRRVDIELIESAT